VRNNGNGNGNGWIQAVLARIEDHILDVRRFISQSEKRWEHNERRWEQNEKRWEQNEKRWEQNNRRWDATHQLIVHMLEEIRRMKPFRS